MSPFARRSASLTGLALAGAFICGGAVAAPPQTTHATLTLVNSHGTYNLTFDMASTLGAFAQKKGISLAAYRTADNRALPASLTVSPTTHITLYERVSHNRSSRLSLKHPVTTVATDQLFVGETKQVVKGQDGVALSTTVTTSLYGLPTSATTSTALTVLKAPKAEILWKGTKPRPVVVVAPPAAPKTTVEASSSSATSRASSERETARAVTPTAAKAATSTTTPVAVVKSKRAAQVAVAVNASAATVLQKKLSLLALEQVGKSYVWGATGPDSFDCSGLIYYLYNQAGVKVPRLTAAGFGAAATPVSFEQLQPGDILWNSTHIGIYIGDGLTVHAANSHSGVKISPLSYWKNSYQAGRLLASAA